MPRLPFRAVPLMLLGALAACGPTSRGASVPEPSLPLPPSGDPKNGLEVIGWMRHTHPSRDLKTLTFMQTAVLESGDTARWLVAAALPGRLRAEALPSSQRSGSIRVRQRLSVFERGRRVANVSGVDLAALLAYDVFAQSIDTTIMWLDSSRVRFGLARRDYFQGRDVWVVGAFAGDTTSDQFWVDSRHWRVVRVIQRDPQSNAINDVRFVDWVELEDVPIPSRAEIYRNGQLRSRHHMSEFAINKGIPSAAFDLARWREL